MLEKIIQVPDNDDNLIFNSTEMHRVLHITHNDGDGIGCALVVNNLRMAVVDTYFCNTGNADDNASDVLNNIIGTVEPNRYTDIIISDVSIRGDVAKRVDCYCKTLGIDLLMVDHHPSNRLSEVYDWVVIAKPINGVPISAAAALAQCLNNESVFDFEYYVTEEDYLKSVGDPHDHTRSKAYSYFITAISRYDTWEWKRHPWSKTDEDMVTLLNRYIGPKDTFDHINSCIHQATTTSWDLIDCKSSYEQVINDMYAKLTDTGSFKTMTFHGFNVIAYMTTENMLINNIKEKLYEDVSGFDIVMGIDPMTRTISLRTEHPLIKVNTIVEAYGGGGHQAAAGASNIDPDVFYNNILKRYYLSNNTKFNTTTGG